MSESQSDDLNRIDYYENIGYSGIIYKNIDMVYEGIRNRSPHLYLSVQCLYTCLPEVIKLNINDDWEFLNAEYDTAVSGFYERTPYDSRWEENPTINIQIVFALRAMQLITPVLDKTNLLLKTNKELQHGGY